MNISNELAHCSTDFVYFTENFVKILHPKRGLIPFKQYDYQKRMINHIENNRFTIMTKFRQGGFSTEILLWFLWRGMFKFGESLIFMSGTDRDSTDCHDLVERVIEWLPEGIRPILAKNNSHCIRFGTGSQIMFRTPEAIRGLAVNWLVINEAAFIKNMDNHWKSMFPTIAAGGNCVVLSTPNGLGNWFQQTYYNAVEKKNSFSVFRAEYTEHPDYSNEKWVAEMKMNLGDKYWEQEIMQNFV